jgi:hypothetical protein
LSLFAEIAMFAVYLVTLVSAGPPKVMIWWGKQNDLTHKTDNRGL